MYPRLGTCMAHVCEEREEGGINLSWIELTLALPPINTFLLENFNLKLAIRLKFLLYIIVTKFHINPKLLIPHLWH